MARAKLADQCLWLKHIEAGPLRNALGSIHPGGTISLLVDGIPVDFERMATGKDGRVTDGFNPVGSSAATWRARYVAGEHQDIELDFAGRIDA
ncbi:hypothetical protein A6F68_02342 [Tsuneonella dongtanensis]|uniref:Uncharacterized protein n=1 Tax=Tsuneonella dongtanensis TaxID=692370 RepID=A0A1B2AFF3_9SPHN|nr:hypothetical protein [Tsuneonella dongtanensis]ANY20841.1 hypothetical protein A6F68_02342 [Tsuneonella dongtanensis]